MNREISWPMKGLRSLCKPTQPSTASWRGQFPGRRSHPSPKSSRWRLWALLLLSHWLIQGLKPQPVQAQLSDNCRLDFNSISNKVSVRQAAFQGDVKAQARYQDLIQKHAQDLATCRSRNWPQTQAIWLRLYPCDAQPGVLEALLDRIVNKGYNEIYVEVFYSGQLLLPAAENSTPWPSILRNPGQEKVDLLSQVINKGHERGLKVYAWLFTMNFGSSYADHPDRQQVLARNGRGQTTLSMLDTTNLKFDIGATSTEETFIDPFNNVAKYDYYAMVEAVAKRRPDGVLFDYIRYPKGLGPASIASRVQDLWIYGPASQQALIERGTNQKGQELIRRFISKGHISAGDVAAVNKLYPSEREPMWQGRQSFGAWKGNAAQQQPILQQQLWYLAVAHAVQGILDFLATAMIPLQRQGIPAGTVFFPEGNQIIGKGFDSRLQPWDQFATAEWHPMSYAVCGNSSCIAAQVKRVLKQAPANVRVAPVLAGVWGQALGNRPPLEDQMQAIRQAAPQISSVSHFAYSWQEPESDRDRRSCRSSF